MRKLFRFVVSANLIFSILFLLSCKNSDDVVETQILFSIQYDYDRISDPDCYLVTKYYAVKNDNDTYTMRLFATYHFERNNYSNFTDDNFRRTVDSLPTIWFMNENYKMGTFKDYSITKTDSASEMFFSDASGENHIYYIPVGIPHADYFVESPYILQL